MNQCNESTPKITTDPIELQSQETNPIILTEARVKNMIEEAKTKVKEEVKIEIDRQVQTDKSSLTTVFGLFASIISLLTIEFQFLKTVHSFEKILGFSLILFALLLGFNIGLDYLVKNRIDKEILRPHWLFYVIIAVTFSLGVWKTSQGDEEMARKNKIYKQYSDDFEKKLNSFRGQYDQKIDQLNSEVEKLRTSQSQLQQNGLKSNSIGK